MLTGKTKVSVDFHVCISVPLTGYWYIEYDFYVLIKITNALLEILIDLQFIAIPFSLNFAKFAINPF